MLQAALLKQKQKDAAERTVQWLQSCVCKFTSADLIKHSRLHFLHPDAEKNNKKRALARRIPTIQRASPHLLFKGKISVDDYMPLP